MELLPGCGRCQERSSCEHCSRFHASAGTTAANLLRACRLPTISSFMRRRVVYCVAQLMIPSLTGAAQRRARPVSAGRWGGVEWDGGNRHLPRAHQVASHDRRDAVRPPALGDLVDAALVDLPLGRDLGTPDCLLRESSGLPPRCAAESHGVDCTCRRDEFGWWRRHPAVHASMGRLRYAAFVITHAGPRPQ